MYIEVWKIEDFNGVWTCDLAITVRRSNQLSYEATDVGSWSFAGSNEPVRDEWEVIYNYEIFHINYWTADVKSSRAFIAQLVRVSHRYHEVMGSNPLEVLNFSGFYPRNCINCVHNCKNHRLFDFTSAVQYRNISYNLCITSQKKKVWLSLCMLVCTPAYTASFTHR